MSLRNSLVGVVLAVAALSGGQVAQAAGCSDDHVQLRGAFGQASFAVEIADTDGERALGLMNRPSMPRFSGMLFVWQTPQHAVFWMENTLIPLDMLFIESQGVVRTIHENAVPMDRTPIDGGEGIQYVLEINGGMAHRLGLVPGAELRHPAIPQQTAAWPCSE